MVEVLIFSSSEGNTPIAIIYIDIIFICSSAKCGSPLLGLGSLSPKNCKPLQPVACQNKVL